MKWFWNILDKIIERSLQRQANKMFKDKK